MVTASTISRLCISGNKRSNADREIGWRTRTRAGTVKLTDNMGHTRLVAHNGGKVHGLLGVIPGERFDLAAVAGGTLAWQEAKRTMAGGLVLFSSD